METDRRESARLHRSALYVPGHISDWMPEAARSGADLLILDLEDSVPVTEKAHARGLIAAMEAAERKGSAAVTYEGLMVDYAMVTTARELLALADAIETRSGGRVQ